MAESLLERVAIALRLGPRPLLETHATLLLAQSIMVATEIGVFEALQGSPLSAPEVAARCRTDPAATAKLLATLVATGYLRRRGECYGLRSPARTWLLADSPRSLAENVLFRFIEWGWIARLGSFVRTGRPLDIHREMTPAQWGAYQRAMRALATCLAPEMVRRTPLPRRPRAMLDIGGAHGYFSVALCRRHRTLGAVILDLPEAVAEAAPILAREGMSARVVHRAGDALTEDLGCEAFDLVLISNLVHHFGAQQSRDLVRRSARALRPGGFLVIQEMVAAATPQEAGQVATLADLYFALTSEAGTLSFADLAAWQREAGLAPRRPVRFLTFPGVGQQSARKPR